MLIISLSFISCSGKKGKGKNDGATFNFEKFEFSTKGLYNEIDQSSIKAVKVSFRLLTDTSEVNNFLFNPEIRQNNHISLIDLIAWAIEEKGLTVYDLFSDHFTQPLNPEDAKQSIKLYSDFKAANGHKASDNEPVDTNNHHLGVTNYLLMESTIYGKDNNVIAIRPIGLCPYLIFYDDQIGRLLRRPLFWIYFPDIMPLLSNQIPESKVDGIKTSLDFFTKNIYTGAQRPELSYNTPLLNDKMPGDTLHYVEGFDVDWFYNHTKDGMYIDPYNKLYQGNGKQNQLQHSDLAPEPEINRKLITSAKYNDYTLNLRNIENYPLYFPEIPYLGQKSLIDVIYTGIREGKITANSLSKSTKPLSLNEVEAALGKKTLSVRVQTLADRMSDTVIVVDFNSSDIKKYIVKEVGFYDPNGTIIESRIMGIIPVREIINEQSGKATYKPLFFIPLINPETKEILSSNFAYRFTSDDNISYMTLLQNKKYKVESTETKPVSVSNALKEF